MAKFQTVPSVVEATQWFMHGDHKGVIPFRNEDSPDLVGSPKRYDVHSACDRRYIFHGWIESADGNGLLVCPHDFVLEHENGTLTVCDPDTFM